MLIVMYLRYNIGTIVFLKIFYLSGYFCAIQRKGFFIMKGKKLILPIAALALSLCMGLVACNGGGEGGDESTPSQETSAKLEKISVSAANDKKTLILGETVQLSASVNDVALEGVTWEAKNAEVATVDANGLVTSVSVGSTSIIASKEGYKNGSISIKVELQQIVVTAAEGKTTLVMGETVQLSADQQGVTWKTSDANIATVSDAGLVTGVYAGQAVISAEKEGFDAGSVSITVTRPAPTATLHMEDADHFSADGMWGMNYNGTIYGPGAESPVYERTGNASDGTCIAYMDNGDKETLTFTSDVAVKAEFVMMMAARSAIEDMSTVMNVKLNDVAVDLAGKAFAGGGDTNTFLEFSFGELDIIAGNNVLEFDFLASSPYFDDLNIYAESAATIAVVLPVEKDPVTIDQEEIKVAMGATFQITSTMTELSFASSDETIATVSDAGLVSGVKVGAAAIIISKDGYKTIRVPVTVTEAEGVIVASVENLTGEGITTRTSGSLTAPYNYIIDEFPVDAVGTIAFEAKTAGTYELYMTARASGGYSSTTTDDLATCMELKINGVKLDLTGEVSGSFTEYLLGEVTLTAGAGTVEIKCLTTVPTINMFRFVPKA